MTWSPTPSRVIAVQSGVGAHVLTAGPRRRARPWRPSRRPAARPWRAARLLGVLRQEADDAGAAWPRRPAWPSWTCSSPRRPGPGCGSTVPLEGEPCRLPAGVDLSAYRVVQEALTNVVRHAGPASRAGSRSATTTARWRSRSPTTAARARAGLGGRAGPRWAGQRQRRRQRPAAWRMRRAGQAPSAAAWRPAPAPAAASGSQATLPVSRRVTR